jgi:hypothetical protein
MQNQFLLGNEKDSLLVEFPFQAFLIHRFQKSAAHLAVHLANGPPYPITFLFKLEVCHFRGFGGFRGE